MRQMSRSHDLTTGSISTHFRTLAVPAAIGMVFSTLYNVVDVYFAGMVNTEAQAGLAIAFQAFFLLATVGIGLGAAMGALVGAALGRKDAEGARRMTAQGISYGVIATFVLWAIWLVVGPLLIAAMSVPGGYRDAANSYFMLLLWAAPGFLLAFGVNGILQAQGDAVSMQYALICAFFANVVLNPLLIFGIPGLWDGIGFNGIALSTVISQSGAMIFILWRVFHSPIGIGLKRSDFRPNAPYYRQITAQLLPTSFAMIVLIGASFVIQYFMKNFGQSAVAAYGIAIRIEQIFLLPVFGLTGALLPIAAQNYGAGESARVRQTLFDCWKFGLMYMCLACPILWFAADAAMRVFTDAPDVIRIGVSYLHVEGLILPAYMILFSVNSFLQALRRPIWALWIGLYRQAFAIAFFVWIYVAVLDLHIMGVWYGIATSVLSGLILSLIVAHRVSNPLIGGLLVRRHPLSANETVL